MFALAGEGTAASVRRNGTSRWGLVSDCFTESCDPFDDLGLMKLSDCLWFDIVMSSAETLVHLPPDV